MSGASFGGLEIISRQPPAKVSPRNTPLLFLHGAYAAAWCWDEHFLSYFAERGYASHALSFSGHGASPGRERLDSFGIDHYVADAAAVAAQLPAPPVLVGHSMGGLVAQKYLEQHEAAGVVLLASVPPQGLWAAALGLAFQKPGLLGDLNRLLEAQNRRVGRRLAAASQMSATDMSPSATRKSTSCAAAACCRGAVTTWPRAVPRSAVRRRAAERCAPGGSVASRRSTV